MNYRIKLAGEADEAFLWQMLYYAAHMDEDGAAIESARTNPDLAGYVENWGARERDLGVVAIAADGSRAGAAWIRVMPPDNPLYRLVAPGTPELAIAVAPDHIGMRVGTLMLSNLIETARGSHRAIALSVRDSNPAKHLYDRFGFVTLGRVTNRVGGNSYVMSLILE